jgi:hypothetical protein
MPSWLQSILDSLGSVGHFIWDWIKETFSELFSFINRGVTAYATTVVGIQADVEKIEAALDQAKSQWQDFQDWTFTQPDWKTHVIWVPGVLENLLQLKDQIVGIFTDQLPAIKDAFTALKNGVEQAISSQSQPVTGSDEAGGVIANIESQLTTIMLLMDQATDLLVSFLDFTQTIDNIKNQIQSLDGLFLSQANVQSSPGTQKSGRQRGGSSGNGLTQSSQ